MLRYLGGVAWHPRDLWVSQYIFLASPHPYPSFIICLIRDSLVSSVAPLKGSVCPIDLIQ